jgi:hypothetical protein
VKPYYMFMLSVIALTPTCAVAADSLCRDGEAVLFSCKIANSKKFVSLCGSTYKDPTTSEFKDNFWLQYRFGALGRPELVYPETKKNSLDKFQAEYHHPYQAFLYSLTFQSGSFLYGIHYWGTEEPFYGVMVFEQPKPGSTRTPKEMKLPCESMPDTHMDFFSIVLDLSPR